MKIERNKAAIHLPGEYPVFVTYGRQRFPSTILARWDDADLRRWATAWRNLFQALERCANAD